MNEKNYCSFCGKEASEVLCLIAGPMVFICDECVGLCNDIVLKHRIVEAVQQLLPDKNIETPPAFRPTAEFIAEVRAKIAASGTPTRRAETTGSVGEADGGPTPQGDAK